MKIGNFLKNRMTQKNNKTIENGYKIDQLTVIKLIKMSLFGV